MPNTLLGVLAMASLTAALLFARFWRTTRDRFFLCIEASDPQFDEAATRQFLERLGAASVSVVQP